MLGGLCRRRQLVLRAVTRWVWLGRACPQWLARDAPSAPHAPATARRTCKQCDGITEVCRSMTRNPMCLCTAAMALLAPVPAVATMVIASMDLAAGSPCAAPQAEWVVVQAVVLLLHMAYAVYACCSFARPYVGAPPPPGLEVASEQARRNRDESQADRMRYLVCYDPVTAVYILLGGLFGAVWLILSPVWFGDAASLAGCPAETLSARQWAEGCGVAVLVAALLCCCCFMVPAAGVDWGDVLCDACCVPCIACCCRAVGCTPIASSLEQSSRENGRTFHDAVLRSADEPQRRRAHAAGAGGTPAGAASRAAYASGAPAPKRPGPGDEAPGGRAAGDVAELPPHRRRPHHSAPTTFTGIDTTSPPAPAAPVARSSQPAGQPVAPAAPRTPSGPGLPRRGGQGSDVPPHKRAPAAATKAGATAPAEPPEAEAEPGAGAGAGAAAGPADAEAGGAATRVGHALGALVGGVVGFMAPKKPR